jgi:hypothetical protein
MSHAQRNGWRITSLLVVAALCSVPGCGESADTAPVTGTVTVEGEPLAGGLVSFFPSGGGRAINGTVDASGAYSVELPTGNYTVIAQASTQLPEGWQEGDPVPPPAVQVPLRYRQPTSSPWSLSVEGTEPVEEDFQSE